MACFYLLSLLKISLGELSASFGGELPLIEGGRVAIVGSSDNTGRVLRVDLLTITRDIPTATLSRDMGQHFFAGMSVLSDQVVVGDFNTGLVWNLSSADLSEIQPAINSGLPQLGPSRTVNGAVIQAGITNRNEGHAVRLTAA